MDTEMRSERRGGTSPSSRLRLAALAAALLAGIGLLGTGAPAQAQAPFPAGAQATALVGGAPLIQASCPAGSIGDVDGGNSSTGTATVGSPAGARCDDTAAAADGLYTLAGVTSATPLRFSADCVNSTGQTGGGVDVPAGTTVAGLGVVTETTTITTPNTAVTYPGGTTAILNQVVAAPTSVTRNAIVVTGGPAAGTVIGRVVCGAFVYPLAVDVSSGSAAAPALAAQSSGDSGTDTATLLAGAAIALAIVAQVAVGRRMWLRRKGETTA